MCQRSCRCGRLVPLSGRVGAGAEKRQQTAALQGAARGDSGIDARDAGASLAGMGNSGDGPRLTPDQQAAQYFLTELRTRISTQPLPYQHGVEASALKSLWAVFNHARDAIKKHPGCEHFAARVTHVLNVEIRPVTAKWHRALEEGRLDGRDGADAFRGELLGVQEKLRRFAGELYELAYDKKSADKLSEDVMKPADLEELFRPLAYGCTACARVDAEQAADIAGDEKAEVQKRRQLRQPRTLEETNAVGLALSGGGIRSATFSLGVTQVLAEKGLLKQVDFLSTVSGGGYTGSFLARRLGEGADEADFGKPHGPDPEPIQFLRQRARFLAGGIAWERWTMVTAALVGMALNWTVPLLFILVLAVIASLYGELFEAAWPMSVFIAGGLSLAAAIVYGWGMRKGAGISKWTGLAAGLLLGGTAFLAAGWLVEQGYLWFVKAKWKDWSITATIGALMALLPAALPAITRFAPVLKQAAIRKLVLKLSLLLASLLAPLGGLLLFYLFREFADGQDVHGWSASTRYLLLGGGAVACCLISLFVININLTGPHRLYRDCLAGTFIRKAPTDTIAVPLTETNPMGAAPYHLINTALNVPASDSPALKDRGCDFFLFSKHWTGAPALRYVRTSNWLANGKPVDLATAMAVSGAAFSAHMGLGSMPALRALLALLNVRLGFWIKRPDSLRVPGAQPKFLKTVRLLERKLPATLFTPGFLCLLKEITGIGMTEKTDWLNLSDGGHIENLAIYELLRRRCKFILCVDGEADPTFAFQGLMTLVRHAQIDFGIKIEPKLDDLRPDSETRHSKCHFHLCRIHYPKPDGAPPSDPPPLGLLLYLKLSVTGNESELIRRYRANNPDFPHQTTLDQFFDQEQFEAYRQLGVHVAETLFLPALMENTSPTTVPDWFKQLARNLLEPETP